MVPDTHPTRTIDRQTDDSGSSTAMNALVGAAAGIVLSFVPLSTLLGGAIAGYLEGGTPNDGLKVGAIAGLVMAVPFVLFGYFVLLLFTGFGPGGPPVAFGVTAVFVLVVGALYTVGLSALGGYLGIYLRDEL